MEKEILSWEITSAERKSQIQKFISEAWLSLLVTLIGCLFYFSSNFLAWIIREGITSAFFKVLSIVISVALFVWLFFFLNKIIPYSHRTYRLYGGGIEITKNKRRKFFSWKEFECFYPYRLYQSIPKQKHLPGETQRKELLAIGQRAEGRIFYLRKRAKNLFSKLYKIFIVVYGEPNNSENVSQFLSQHLPKKKMTSTTDLGLVFYQFK